MPGHVGLFGGFFYGLSFGLWGIAAAILGGFADSVGIETIYRLCSYLPVLGLLAWSLPPPRSQHP
jgi:FSR family fosmidomycin resistance protein-like MFS transporter